MDDALAFVLSQLTHVESKIYEAKYQNIFYAEMVPVDTSMPEHVTSVTYISYDGVTMGKFIAADAKDLPGVAVHAGKTTVPVGYAGNSFTYSREELRQTAALNLPVDSIKGKLAFRGAEEHVQSVVFNGDTDLGMTGLFNNANVSSTTDATNFATATGQEMVAALDLAISQVWETSKGVFLPGDVAIPADIWKIITIERMDSGTDTTVLQYFKENNFYTTMTGQPLNVRSVFQLDAAGAGGVSRIMAYEKSPENVSMYMPMLWRPLEPQIKDLDIKTPCEYKFGGTNFKQPLSAFYVDLTAH